MIKIIRTRHEGERYDFDFGTCSFKKGFAQFDTKQDASWFGTWVNPFTLKYVCFAEGDLEIKDCDTTEEFCEVVRHAATLNGFEGIDAMKQDHKDKFAELGLADLLH